MAADRQTKSEHAAASGVPLWRRLWQQLRSRFARQIALGAVVVGAIVATGHFVGGMIGWWHAYELSFGGHNAARPPAVPPRAKAPPLSIVVLPFANAGAVEDGWFAENLTNDIAVELSRLPDGSVVGREAAAKYRGQEADPREVAKELGVRYVLAGSVERAGDKVRLRARLLDGVTGVQRWAERFDIERASLPGLVDELARKLARTVDVEMVRSTGAAAARLAPEAVTAEDLAMQGWAVLYRGVNRKTAEEALALFERAVAIDADSVRGWGGIAYASAIARRSARSERDLTRLETAAGRLERLDPDGYYGVLARGMLAFDRRDWQAALAAGDLMVHRFPGHLGSYLMRGAVLVRMGRFEEALTDTEKAIALLPNAPDASNDWRRSFIYYGIGRYAEAAAGLRQLLAKNPTNLAVVFPLAAALARDGRPDEARQVLDSARRQYPDLSTTKIVDLQFERPGERFIAARDDMLAALREIGLP